MTTMTPAAGMPTLPAAGTNRPLVIGLDLSLRSTGIAGDGWGDALRPRPGKLGHLRLSWLLSEITDRIRVADLVVVEGPAYAQQLQQGHHERAGLWWMVTHALWRRDIPYAVCPPQQRAMYVTGKGSAGKDAVLAGVRTLLGLECEGPGKYDIADAASMAALGYHWLGYPLAVVPADHARALEKVAWPEQVPAVAR